MNAEHVELDIGGLALEVRDLEGQEQLSALWRFDVSCVAPAGERPAAMLGREGHLVVRDAAGRGRRFEGICCEARQETFDDGTASLRIAFVPKAHRLTRERSCRVFHDRTVPEIVRSVCEEHAIAMRDQTTETYSTRAYTAQYREDTWSFLRRLLEEEGIFVRFEHDDAQSILVLEDRSTAADDLPGGGGLAFAYATGRVSGSEHVHELARELRVTPDEFMLSSYDPVRPDVAIGGSSGVGALRVYRAEAGGPDTSEKCARRARIMHERAACRGRAFVGVSTSARMEPGRVVTVAGHPDAGYDARYFVCASRLTVRQRSEASGEGALLLCRFEAISAEVPFRAALDTPRARQRGLQTAVVVGAAGTEVYPDARGRVRVKHHWDRSAERDEATGTWMRTTQRASGGSLVLPRVGWTVTTFNEEGAVDAPTVLRRMHDGEHPPVYDLSKTNTRVVYRTATTPCDGSVNEVHFEDKKGLEVMQLDASRDMNLLTQLDKLETVGQDASTTIGKSRRLAVSCNAREEVGGNQTITVGGDERCAADGSLVRVVCGDETVVVGGNRNASSGSHQDNVSGTRRLRVGAAMIDTALGSIGTSSERDLIAAAGGAVARIAGASVTEQIGKISVQTVAGVKLEVAADKYRLSAVDHLSERVGISMQLHADGELRDVTSTRTELHAATALTLDAPEIVLVADKTIELVCGSSKLVVEADAITLTGIALGLSGSETLTASAPLIEHNP